MPLYRVVMAQYSSRLGTIAFVLAMTWAWKVQKKYECVETNFDHNKHHKRGQWTHFNPQLRNNITNK